MKLHCVSFGLLYKLSLRQKLASAASAHFQCLHFRFAFNLNIDLILLSWLCIINSPQVGIQNLLKPNPIHERPSQSVTQSFREEFLRLGEVDSSKKVCDP